MIHFTTPVCVPYMSLYTLLVIISTITNTDGWTGTYGTYIIFLKGYLGILISHLSIAKSLILF